MSKALLLEAISPLPYALREQVEGYAAFIEETAEDIFSGSEAKVSKAVRDEFIFLAGIRRLWMLVDGQYWLIDRSLALGSQFGVYTVAAGRSRFARGTGAHADLRQLRTNLVEVLTRLEIAELVQVSSLDELLLRLIERRDRGSS